MSSPSYIFLRKLALFADLGDADLERLCEHVEEIRLKAGEVLFEEGDTGHQAYVIKEGQVEIYKTNNGRNVQLAVRQPGEVIGEMSLLQSAPRNASGRALADSLLLAISHEHFDSLLDSSPAARTMLHTVTARLRSTELMLRQSEKMAVLGNLTAGVAHELNNPAAAARRGAEQLRQTIQDLGIFQARLLDAQLPAETTQALLHLSEQAYQAGGTSVALAGVERGDHEADLEEWLEELGVVDAWEVASRLVDLEVHQDDLKKLIGPLSPDARQALLGWLGAQTAVVGLLAEIQQGAGRISEIVASLKSYAYLDQAPVLEVDVRTGLDNTLVMLRYKLKQGIEVRREYAPDLPQIQAYASELNQVWTNIIDNAIDAMEGKGVLTIRAAYREPWVVVEIEDTGPGIPEEVRDKIFDPFFTTKPMGKGTGLGLNITYTIIQKHRGDIQVFSRPGQTCFEVRLPINFSNLLHETVKPVERLADEKLLEILKDVKTIAVVGISDKPERPAHTVPAYLQKHGYEIIPVNPTISEVLGKKTYPDLLALPEPPDAVLIFRASENVPPVVDQAIQVGAKVVWMQEGIVNEPAAQKARQAGIQVVMDTCMRETHKRLIEELQ